jgi:hypothetical protein
MTSKSSNSPFERGLVELQKDFKVLPVGIARTGAWRYSFIYELVHRYHPEIPDQARSITRKEARQKLTALYFAAVGAATVADVRRLFQWKSKEVERTLHALVDNHHLRAGYTVKGSVEEHLVAPELLAGTI